MPQKRSQHWRRGEERLQFVEAVLRLLSPVEVGRLLEQYSSMAF